MLVDKYNDGLTKNIGWITFRGYGTSVKCRDYRFVYILNITQSSIHAYVFKAQQKMRMGITLQEYTFLTEEWGHLC